MLGLQFRSIKSHSFDVLDLLRSRKTALCNGLQPGIGGNDAAKNLTKLLDHGPTSYCQGTRCRTLQLTYQASIAVVVNLITFRHSQWSTTRRADDDPAKLMGALLRFLRRPAILTCLHFNPALPAFKGPRHCILSLYLVS